MRRIIHKSWDNIDQMEPFKLPTPDPRLISEVQQALQILTPDLRKIVTDFYFDGFTVNAIAQENNISREKAYSNLLKARRILRILLGDLAQRRWGIKMTCKCRLCVHPHREIIDGLLRMKSNDENWGTFCRRLKEATGERFFPPQILKAHLEHIRIERNDTHEQR